MENRTVLLSAMAILLFLPTVCATDQMGRGEIRSLGDTNVEIEAFGSYSFYYEDCEEDGRIYGTFEVTSGPDVDFFICDRATYGSWVEGNTVSVYRLHEGVVSLSYSFNLPADGTWHIVFYNNNEDDSIRIEGSVHYQSPGAEALSHALSVMPWVGVPVALLLAAIFYSRSKKSAARPVSHPRPPEPTQIASSLQTASPCPHCGAARRSSLDESCAACGQPYPDGPVLR